LVKYPLYLILLLILLVNLVSGVCTVTFDKSSYRPGETVTATMICDKPQERSKIYDLNWYNGTILLETDTGITPALTSLPFFETYIIPTNAVDWVQANATLLGTNLEGGDYFNVSGNATNLLKINDGRFSPLVRIGDYLAMDLKVTNAETGKGINGAFCSIFVTDDSGAPLQNCRTGYSFDSRVSCGDVLSADQFMEGNQYLANVRCICGTGDSVCFDEDGNIEEKYRGSTSFIFTINPWLTVNTITDKSNYNLQDEIILVCANITNNDSRRVSIEIDYNYRCGTPDNATDRVVLDSYTELRGISANTTQNQCALLNIVNPLPVQNKLNTCYAATDVKVLSRSGDTIKFTYATTSPEFNITSNSHVDVSEVNNMLPIILTQFFIIVFFILIGWPHKVGFVKITTWGLGLIEFLMLTWFIYLNQIGSDLVSLLYINAIVSVILGGAFGTFTLIVILFKLSNPANKKPFEEDGYTKFVHGKSFDEG